MRNPNNGRILQVEDEFISALVMQGNLEECGYAVLSANADSPDLILMDIRLAGEMDGIEAGGNAGIKNYCGYYSESPQPRDTITGETRSSLRRRRPRDVRARYTAALRRGKRGVL